jgi:hypothetical protein
MDPFVGKYFSLEYIRRQVLKQTDREILEIDKQIEQEMKDGLIQDPNDPMGEMMGGGMAPEEGAAADPSNPVDAEGGEEPLFTKDDLDAEDKKLSKF